MGFTSWTLYALVFDIEALTPLGLWHYAIRYKRNRIYLSGGIGTRTTHGASRLKNMATAPPPSEVIDVIGRTGVR